MDMTMFLMRVEAHAPRKKYTVRRGLVLPTMAAAAEAVLATMIGPRTTIGFKMITMATMAEAVVDDEAEVGADLQEGVVVVVADRLIDRVGAGAIGIGIMMTTLAGGATAAADLESAAAAESVIAVDQGAEVEVLIGRGIGPGIGPENVIDPAEGRGVKETAEAGDHTVGAGAENAIETGENVQRRVVAADPKMAAAVAVERMQEIE